MSETTKQQQDLDKTENVQPQEPEPVTQPPMRPRHASLTALLAMSALMGGASASDAMTLRASPIAPTTLKPSECENPNIVPERIRRAQEKRARRAARRRQP